MEINHFSHDHPLILSEEKYITNFPCGVCSEPISGLSYACQICPYILHKWCSELPRELPSNKNHLPDHPLVLTPQTTSECSTLENCKLCRKEIKFPASAYTCVAKERCSFSLHVECASLPQTISFEFPDINKLTTTNLYYMRKYQEDCICVICRYSCVGPLYFTLSTETRYIHVHCAMLPRKVKHKRHLHDLTFHPPLDEKGKYFEFFCDVCEQERDPDEHVYYCETCEVVAHIACGISGTERPIQDILGTCPVYELSMGVIREDESAKELVEPEEVKEEREEENVIYFNHEHAVVLINYTRPIDKNCRRCSSPVFGKTYSCARCDLYLHKWCAQLPEEIQHWMHPQHGSLKLFLSPMEIMKGDRFSLAAKPIYPHVRQSFIDPKGNLSDRQLFQGCDDDFKGDEMDDQIVDSLADNPPLFCTVCSKQHFGISYIESGSYYKCAKCIFLMHGICAMLPKNLNHKSHEHTLSIYRQEKEAGSHTKPQCQACRFPCKKLVSLYCESCNFYLHVQCFLFPYTGKHITHRHSLKTLNLTYSYKEDPRALEYFCDLCEKPRIPNRWVYSCPDPDCVIVGHMDCVVPNPFAISQIKSEQSS